MNKIILKGRLTRDPQVASTSGENPVAVAKFTLACEDRERGKDADGNYPVNYIPCVCLAKTAEIVEKNLCKGKEILLFGKMQSGTYEKAGKTVYSLECFVREIEFCGKKEETPKYDKPFMVTSEGYVGCPF